MQHIGVVRRARLPAVPECAIHQLRETTVGQLPFAEREWLDEFGAFEIVEVFRDKRKRLAILARKR